MAGSRAGRGGSDSRIRFIAAAALILVTVGVIFFRERLSPAILTGIVLCVVGLLLFNRK